LSDLKCVLISCAFSFPSKEILKVQIAVKYLTPVKSHHVAFEKNLSFAFAVFFLLSLPVTTKMQTMVQDV